jgi:RNA polymerase sigma factor (sigma-70 family)
MDAQRRPEAPLQASGSLASGADRELLARYQATGDQDALGEIVRRHARLAYAACLRVLGDHHAAQAAFVTFCRRARQLSDEGSLRAWLYETARLTAVVHRRNLAIRRKHEEQAMREPGRSIPSFAAADDDLMAGLDQALDRLAPKLRESVLLRYMEGLSNEEAAAELRCPAGTISARASRGLEKLRHYFAKRGFTISAGALAAALGEAQAVELPVGLASRALAVCTGEAAMSDSTLAAVKGVERAMFWSKARGSALAAVGRPYCEAAGRSGTSASPHEEGRLAPWERPSRPKGIPEPLQGVGRGVPGEPLREAPGLPPEAVPQVGIPQDPAQGAGQGAHVAVGDQKARDPVHHRVPEPRRVARHGAGTV